MSGINGIVIGVGEVALEPETRGGTLGEIGGGVRLGLRRTFGDAVGDEDTSMLRSSLRTLDCNKKRGGVKVGSENQSVGSEK